MSKRKKQSKSMAKRYENERAALRANEPVLTITPGSQVKVRSSRHSEIILAGKHGVVMSVTGDKARVMFTRNRKRICASLHLSDLILIKFPMGSNVIDGYNRIQDDGYGRLYVLDGRSVTTIDRVTLA